MGDPIKVRRQALGIRSMRKAALEAGLSEAVWRQLETGRRQIAPGQVLAPTPTDETKAAVARALRWTADSIDLLLAHEEPIIRPTAPDMDPAGHGGIEEKFVSLEKRVDHLFEEMAELRRVVDELP